MNDKSQYENILTIVKKFYHLATQDIIIGFHFRNIKDFDTHLPRIASFWELILFNKATHVVSPPFDLIRIHQPLKITTGQLNRWIFLFNQVLLEEGPRYLDQQIIDKWDAKLDHFKTIFLSHPNLFTQS